MSPPHVLIVDDERNFRDFLAEALEGHGYRVETAATARAALASVREKPPDIVLLDQNLPDGDGVELLAYLQQLPASPVVIIVTAYADYPRAVRAIKAGAFHYIAKPFEFDYLLETLAQACIEVRNGQEEEGAESPALAELVGCDPRILALKRRVARVARSSVGTVLVCGESGTGKELVARILHELSPRGRRRMVSVNCAALSDTLLLSELFGHEKGAFTDAREQKKGLFEAADGGTLFLDEVSEMGPRAQAALLRVVEQRALTRVGGTQEVRVDVRIVAATNQPLERLVVEGRFRADLYYRLNVVQLELPPLRERGSDVLLLARHFARRIAAEHGVSPRTLSPEAEAAIAAYPWPGNVRQLRNAIERAYVVGSGCTIRLEDLPPEIVGARPADGSPPAPASAGAPRPFRDAKREAVHRFERTYLEGLLARTGGNVSRAAAEAGMHRQAFQRLLRRHGLDREVFAD